MAYSFAAISASEVTSMAADKPLVCASNAVRNYSDIDWRTSGSFTGGSDATDADFPTKRLQDSQTNLVTKSDGATTTWYLIMDLGTSGDDIDTAFLMNHNLGTVGGMSTVSLQFSNTNTFTTTQTVATWTNPANDNRLQKLSLTHNTVTSLRYSGVQYARVKTVSAGNTTPEFGEIILGRRRQLSQKPIRPYAVYSYGRDSVEQRSESGVISRNTLSRGQRFIDAGLQIYTDADETTVKAIWTESGQGRYPIVWVEDPTTDPGAFNLMWIRSEGFALPRAGPNLRTLSLSLEEQGADYQQLDA